MSLSDGQIITKLFLLLKIDNKTLDLNWNFISIK